MSKKKGGGILLSKTFIIALLTSIMLTTTAFGYTIDKSDDSGHLMLVSSEHMVDKDYNPDRVQFENTYYYLRKEAAESLERMLRDMKVELGEAPMIISTYRSYEKQESVYNSNVDDAVKNGADLADAIKETGRYIALPGASEHQTALAVDLSNDGSLEENFIETEAGIWIREHCHEYGFIVRYPKEKEMFTGIGYEPWHIRYVGEPSSDIMYQNNWCLEEYIEYLENNGSIIWNDGKYIWNVYYVDSFDCSYANIVDISDTNTGGYIIITCRDKDSLLTKAQTLKNRINLMDNLISRIAL